MRYFAYTSVVVALALTAIHVNAQGAGSRNTPATNYSLAQGQWRGVKPRTPTSGPVRGEWTIRKSSFSLKTTWDVKGKTQSATIRGGVAFYTLFSPKQIRLSTEGGVRRGIYRISKDTFVTGFKRDPKVQPKSWDNADEVIVWRRVR